MADGGRIPGVRCASTDRAAALTDRVRSALAVADAVCFDVDSTVITAEVRGGGGKGKS